MDYFDHIRRMEQAMYRQMSIPAGMLGLPDTFSEFNAAAQAQTMFAQTLHRTRERLMSRFSSLAWKIWARLERQARWRREADEERTLSGWRERIAWARGRTPTGETDHEKR
ncbi:MAG: hypothetical protein ACYTEX_10930 [Planctomycetota bacterium]|jgi:hypothetical protein